MPIVAAVTRASASRFFSQQGSVNPGNTGGNAYTLRKADGTSLGTYRSVSEAQQVFKRFHGANRIHRWERRDLAGDIEQHVCIGTPLNAEDVWVLRQPNPQISTNDRGVSSLRQWMEPNAAAGSVKVESATGVISSVSDLSGSNHPLLAVEDPVYVESDADFLGKPVVDFDQTGAPFNGLELLGSVYTLSPPFTMILVANNLNPGSNGVLWNTDVFPRLNVTEGPGGVWRMNIEAIGNVDSTVVGSNTPDILVIEATPIAVGATFSFRVNGADVGSLDATDVGVGIEMGGYNMAAFDGRVAFHMVASISEARDTRVLQTERYLRQTFGTRA